ncbi:TetR/AcrR family transcriptional regulator [Geodermatophilus sp. TF02-6]|uniref:TetR/AcrR family transcriptional regulator n=1 Tax=Geodermatophilus sp. TF02-6 TaxID=2250575 RepID=UPI0018F555BA|nr:TetR/AcrR family transcriptional regulator [Geodermatophilus sp. TF02-6]
MSEVLDRRARKKAQTRALIRETAQALFAARGFEAVTIVDIATAADVAVQTVFNHFSTKEELFFDGHIPWVDGPATAVRARTPGVAPLTALHAHLTDRVGAYVRSLATPEGRSFAMTLEASPALRAHERELHHESINLLAEALLEAWQADGGVPPLASDPRTAASVTAAVWLAAVRTLVREQRLGLTESAGVSSADPEAGVAVARTVADQVLSGLVSAMSAPPERSVPPESRLRRTG